MTALKRKFAKEQHFPISIQWAIKEENIREANDKSMYSSKLDVPNLTDIKCNIQLQPKRSDKDPKGETYAYLNLYLQNDMSISAAVNMTCTSANFLSKWTYVYTKTGGYGSKICNYDDLFDPTKKIFIDNQLIITVSGVLTRQEVDPTEEKMLKIDNTIGKLLWESEADKDISILIDGENEIKAHKCVLRRRSSKFDKLLNIKPEPNALPNATNGAKVVVKNMSFDTVKEAVMFCYDIQSKEVLSAENAASILTFANEYEIEALKENMEEFCIENLSVSNACLFANSAVTAKTEKLKQKCLQFLANCMKTGTAVKDIEKLNAEMKETLFLQSFFTVCEN